MAYLLKQIGGGYQYLFLSEIDPRVKDYPLAGKPMQVLAILILYHKFVLHWGPQWMKNRQPFNLEKVIMAFDLIQVVCCGYLFYESSSIWLFKYKWLCEPVDFSNSQDALNIIHFVYCYFLMKLADLLDTVFFVLRKKSNQISFLHVYHHTGMVLASWIALTYLPGGHAILIGVINSFVHVVMYFYYFLTMAMPEVKNSMWWKKYVTQIQIIQFLINVVHMGSILFIPNCAYPRWVAWLFLPNNLFMLILFVDFYIKTYIRKPKQKTVVKDNVTSSDSGLRKEDSNIHRNVQ